MFHIGYNDIFCFLRTVGNVLRHCLILLDNYEQFDNIDYYPENSMEYFTNLSITWQQ